jgi:hypothetical protein
VVVVGIVVHLIEGNVVAPLIMSKKVDLPPVLTIVFVLIVGSCSVRSDSSSPCRARRDHGDRAAHPAHAPVRGQGFRRTTRERPLVLRLPASEGGIISRAHVDVSRSWSGARGAPCRLCVRR